MSVMFKFPDVFLSNLLFLLNQMLTSAESEWICMYVLCMYIYQLQFVSMGFSIGNCYEQAHRKFAQGCRIKMGWFLSCPLHCYEGNNPASIAQCVWGYSTKWIYLKHHSHWAADLLGHLRKITTLKQPRFSSWLHICKVYVFG